MEVKTYRTGEIAKLADIHVNTVRFYEKIGFITPPERGLSALTVAAYVPLPFKKAENTAPEMQGRMFGLFGAMFSGFLPLGMLVFGPLADITSLRLLMIISGVLLLILSAVIVFDRKFYNNKPAADKTS